MNEPREVTIPPEMGLVPEEGSPVTFRERLFFDRFFADGKKKVIVDWDGNNLLMIDGGNENEENPERQHCVSMDRFHELTGIRGISNGNTIAALIANGAEIDIRNYNESFSTEEAVKDYMRHWKKVASEEKETYQPTFTTALTSAPLNS